MKIMKFKPKTGDLSDITLAELQPNQKVVLDARNIPGKLDEVYTRAILVLDN